MFSYRKYFGVILLLLSVIPLWAEDAETVFVTAKKDLTQSSYSINRLVGLSLENEKSTAIIALFKEKFNGLKKVQDNEDVEIWTDTALSKEHTVQVDANVRNAVLSTQAQAEYHQIDSLNTKYTVAISDELCDILGVQVGVVVPLQKLNWADGARNLLLVRTNSENVFEKLLVELFVINGSVQKSEKKFIEDLRLRIQIAYFDSELKQHIEDAPSPTTVTSGTTVNFRATGGSGEYTWRLIPSPGNDSSISDTIGESITYSAPSLLSREFDVLYVNDGTSEASVDVIFSRTKLDQNGTGSKGSGGCFIRKKSRQ